MSEDISPQSEKMDVTSDHSIDYDDTNTNTNDETNNDNNEYVKKFVTKTTVVTNSHPLMTVSETSIDNFTPGAHSSVLNLATECVKLETNQHRDSSMNFDLNLTEIESYDEQLPDFPESPTAMKKSLMYEMPVEIDPNVPDQSDTENDQSIYEAVLSPNLQNVSLTMHYDKPGNLNFLAQVSRSNKLRKIKVLQNAHSADSDVSSIESLSESIKSDEVYPKHSKSSPLPQAVEDSGDLDMNFIQQLLDSPDDSIMIDSPELATPKNGTQPEQIEEYSAEDERREARHWQKIVLPNGDQRNIDMRVIEPYKRVLSHGGYLKIAGHNAIILFSACYLPDKSRKDYVYVMDNLFLYVLQTLDQLVTDDYVLVYLHGSANSNCIPTISWLKRCYQLIDRRLRKNLKQLFIVHPTFWLKTIIMMTKPFISSKFYRKLHFINSLQELSNCLPVEQAAIPERVINYDKLKFST